MGADSHSTALDPEMIADEVARVRRLRPAVDAGLDRLDSYVEATIQALADTDG